MKSLFADSNLLLGITTPITLIAFFISVYFSFKIRKSKHDLKKLELLPEAERLTLLQSLEADYPKLIELNSLTKNQRYSLAIKQIHNKESARKRSFYFAATVALLAFLLTIAYLVLNASSQKKEVNQHHTFPTINAGRDINITGVERRKNEGELEITNVRWTNNAEFDVVLRNLGEVDIVITKIEIRKLSDALNQVTPILMPSAKYVFDVDTIAVGRSNALDVAHLVAANKADRILIATGTTTVYNLQVTFYYNKNKSISFLQQSWPH